MNPTPKTTLEVCVDSASGAATAAAAGAHRVELCAGLVEGGLTPSLGTLRAARRECEAQIVVLIRPRAGDFVYDAGELSIMEADIRTARDAGCEGVALGALRPDGRVDRERTARLAECARPLAVTFHRAFDLAIDLDAALEDLVALGIDRVLSCGGAASVPDGLIPLTRLVARAGDRIEVIPAGGVRDHNVREVVRITGARAVHFTANRDDDSPMQWRNDVCRLGAREVPGEYVRRVTDAERVRAYVAALR